MHTYRKDRNSQLWTVGHFVIIGDTEGVAHRWQPMRDFAFEQDAASYVNYLNGGSGDEFEEVAR